MQNLIQISVFKITKQGDVELYNFLMQRDKTLDAQGLMDGEDYFEVMEDTIKQHGKGHYTIAQKFDYILDNGKINFSKPYDYLDYYDLLDNI